MSSAESGQADDDAIAKDAPAVDAGPPVHWPTLTAQQAEREWPALREWVEQLVARFPHTARIPPCWWRHNDLVELLSALRDHERACYASTSPATSAVEWHRALRDVETRAEIWTRRFSCAIAGREHADSASDAVGDWDAFVAAEVATRPAERHQKT